MFGSEVNRAGQGIVLGPREDVFPCDAIEVKKGSPAPWLVGRGSRNDKDFSRSCRLGTYEITRLGRKTRRAVRRDPASDHPFEDENETILPYGKQRLIASNNGFTVSTVSSPIFEIRKVFPLIFP
jgi:hypothetical protein